MSKTLVIAEKPSVGQDISKVLPGAVTKGEGYLELPDHVITWAVGHLVQLADPDEYGENFKKWRMADLPIVPDRFKLVVRDERSKKQMNVIKRQLGRDDVDVVVNACDAGREGELIFAYVYENAGAKKPVERLWLNSMTPQAISDAFGALRPGAELALLEQAARSRSEADWIVGMNATRAATIRLRSSFDGAVSLGRVQTPTLAILARREEEIRAFVPEPYWVVDASFLAVDAPPGRAYEGRLHVGANPRLPNAEDAAAVVAACEGQVGEITKLEKSERRERAPQLYHLTSLQRDANTRFGFSARRTLGAAQKLYDQHKALTYPRTNSRYLPQDMIGEIKPIARLVGERAEYAEGAKYVLGLDVLPLGRVVDDAKVTDHHAIIPTNADSHPVDKMESDERRIYDLVVRRFLAVFHPEAVFENTRVETTVASHVFRTRGKLMLVPGWRGVYGETADPDPDAADDDEGGERDGRALVVTEKGLNVIRLLGENTLTSPSLTGDWEHRLARIETGEDSRKAFMDDIVKFAEETVGELDTKLKDVRIPRANLGPCPVCGRDIVENRKGYSCWGREDPGCGFVIWKSKAGKNLPLAVARELIKTGRTEKQVTGFKGRSGKSFRAKLALTQTEEGKWRVEFDEAWAKEGAKPPEAEAETPPAAESAQPEAA
jgi:DNA topoisomerase III